MSIYILLYSILYTIFVHVYKCLTFVYDNLTQSPPNVSSRGEQRAVFFLLVSIDFDDFFYVPRDLKRTLSICVRVGFSRSLSRK